MDSEEITRCHCNNCGRGTDHAALRKRIIEDHDDPPEGEPPFTWTDTYEMLQCRGCGSVCLRHVYEDIAGERTITYYPPPVSRRPPSWRWQLPIGMRELLNEIYVALRSDSRRLALMGARTLVDMLMLEHVGDIGTFDSKQAAHSFGS